MREQPQVIGTQPGSTLPNFVILGVAKSGTQSVYNYLSQHPDVHVSAIKETNFFIAEGQPNIPYQGPRDRETLEEWGYWVHDLAHYHSLFQNAGGKRAVGEASTWYLYDERAPERIRHYVPEAKLIAVLRNPVTRAYSAYTHMVRAGRETAPDFRSALAAEEERIRNNWEPLWHYKRMGLYGEQVARFYDRFDPAQIKILLSEDLNANSSSVMADLYRFLGVDETFEADFSERGNVTLVPRNRAMQNFLEQDNPVKALLKPLVPARLRESLRSNWSARNLVRPGPMEPDVRAELVEYFRSDVLRLEDLLGRDLSGWLK